MNEPIQTFNSKEPWKILLVDDEPDVIEITSMILEDLKFENRPLSILTAESGIQAQEVLTKNDDIALAFIDVVMEDDHAGLDLINYVRNQLKNKDIRLIIRTGNPGKAPSTDVVRHLEIDDYKEKTDLTADKLETSVLTSLRSYSNLIRKKYLESALKSVIKLSNELNKIKNQHHFFPEYLRLLISFAKEHAHHEVDSSFMAKQTPDGFWCFASTGKYEKEYPSNGQPVFLEENCHILDVLNKYSEHLEQIKDQQEPEMVVNKTGFHPPCDENENHLIISIQFNSHEVYWIGLAMPSILPEPIINLLNILASHLVSALHNALLQHQLISAQSEVLNRLCGSVESRSKETGAHIKRVSLYSLLLAQLAGLDEHQQKLIKESSPMHDIGKVIIPDYILQKNGPLNEEEWTIMKNHPKFGYDLLKHDYFGVMNLGAVIAYSHHEKWDGSGYPQQLAGEEIPLPGRIVALVDVFDALLSKRAYKKAWTIDDVMNTISEQRGKHFDPRLVDLFIENKDKFYQIFLDHPDELIQ